MRRNDPPEDLHLELLSEFNVILNSDGNAYTKIDVKECTIGYCEGPGAWSNSVRFSGPAWVWHSPAEGWSFYENGVTITGCYHLHDTVVNIDENGLHVTKCIGEEY